MITNTNKKSDLSAFAEGFFDHIRNASPELYADLEREIGGFELKKPSDVARTVTKAMAILDSIKDSYDSSKSNNELFGAELSDIVNNMSEEQTDYLRNVVYSLLIPESSSRYMRKISEGALDYAIESILDDYRKK